MGQAGGSVSHDTAERLTAGVFQEKNAAVTQEVERRSSPRVVETLPQLVFVG